MAPALWCHSLVVRCPHPPASSRLRERLEAAAAWWPAVKNLPLWEVRSPAHSSAEDARERTRREAERPLLPGRSTVRAVLVRHADGVADLVLVADRSQVPRALLRRLATALTEGEATAPEAGETGTDTAAPNTSAGAPSLRATAPTWGLGDPSHSGRTGAVTVSVALPHSEEPQLLLSAATALALSRYDGETVPHVAVLDPDGTGPGAVSAYRLEVGEEESVDAFLRRAATAVEPHADDRAEASPLPGTSVGVAFGDAVPGHRYLPYQSPLLPLTLFWEREADGSFTGTCSYDEGAVAPRTAEDFAARVVHLAAQLAKTSRGAGDTVIGSLGTTTDEEVGAIVRAGAAPPVRDAGHGPRSITRRFADVVRQRPDAVALTGGGTTLTYRQLDDRAERMARGLRSRGVEPGALVGVCLERDPGLVVALLAVLKAGCAYVTMDPQYPDDRLRYTATDAGVPLVIGDRGRFPETEGVQVVGAEELLSAVAGSPADGVPVEDPAGGERPAYVIYTSGSTGRPKGVVVPHRNVLALLDATEQDFGLGPDDVWTLFHSSAFDFSVWEIWGCLLTGGRLVVVPFWVTRSPDQFHELLVAQRVTVLNQTPSAFHQLIEADRNAAPLSLRLVVFGGEPLDARTLLPWFARHPHTECRLVNMFGITETTVHVTAQTVTPELAVAGSRSVGPALPGWSVSVRDSRGRVLPPGAAGEIWVGGAGLADRYLGRPELTTERFVTDAVTGERHYRSGDKGRMRPDGSLDHLGRLDSQVKVRGHRIELDEIRSVLLGDSVVTAAAVVLHEPPGERSAARIDAYVVLKPGATEHEVLAGLRRTLPEYMVPSTVTAIASIPLTLNGKLERAALPAPRTATPGPADAPPLRPAAQPDGDPLGDRVLGLWSRHLQTEVRPEDNFFELGGNSLLAVRLLRDLRESRLPGISMQDFYRNSTAGQFVEAVRRAAGPSATAD
ncbi:amino acid adenylation domain-containing protein [Streptomyces diastaticus]|uniref:amino acid adenylation domain-containing protein n=1 Tax=Streptomyces diastaticus TaxID=1956 RepID=UPI0033E0AA2E